MIPLIFWDASSLVKRYYSEIGTDKVHDIFASVPLENMIVTIWGYAEAYSVLHRKRNQNSFPLIVFNQVATKLENEILKEPDVQKLAISNIQVIAGLAYVTKYNLNSNDAAILATYIDYKNSLPSVGFRCFFLAADIRLGRAAQAEGFTWLNPETMSASDLVALIPSAD